MKISLTETGGGLFPVRSPAIEIDTNSLEAGDAQVLQGLLTQARLYAKPIGTGTAMDGIGYRLMVSHEGETYELRQSDADMTAGFGELLNWIRDHAPP